MSEHTAQISWRNTDGDFLRGRFSRRHSWTFDGGLSVPASPSPSVVPEPYSDPAAVDPEEAFVASLASCHMLTFLYIASRKKFEISSYQDQAVGLMAKNDAGVSWVARVTLHPVVEYSGDRRPTREEQEAMHSTAHKQCFISNSVRTETKVELPD